MNMLASLTDCAVPLSMVLLMLGLANLAYGGRAT